MVFAVIYYLSFRFVIEKFNVIVPGREIENEQDIVLHVKDDGKPIENKNILFEPFKTTKTKGAVVF